MVSLVELVVPIVVSAAALFFGGFVSWMVVSLHLKDWAKMDQEDEFLEKLRELDLPPGNYMFPGMLSNKDMETDEYKQKQEQGPNGIITVLGSTAMGPKLVKTFIFNLAVSFCVAYLATMANLDKGATFMEVFRFVGTATMITFLAGITGHSIWFQNRITGHVIESVAFGLIVGAIFGGLWPAS